jgi:hypothetical protein
MQTLTTLRLLGVSLLACVWAASAQDFKVKSVGSVRHGTETQVTVVFSKPVDATTGTNPANYTFSGGITVTGASLMTGLPGSNLQDVQQNPAPFGRVFDNECVVLTVTGLAPNAAASVTIQNIKDTEGNTIAPTVMNFRDSGYSWVDIGVHPIPGKVIAINTNGFDIYSSGVTQWSDEDQTTFVYKEVTGDFEFEARGEFTDFSSRWGRAGIMAREDLNAGESGAVQDTTASRYCGVHANPAKCYNNAGAGIVTANNQFESHFRSLVGGETASTAGGTPQWPNAWLRMRREGDTIFTYRSDDGLDWVQMAERTVDDPGPWNPKLYVGFAFSPETGNINAANPPDAKNRLFLFQVRTTRITVPRVNRFDPNPVGFRIEITDAESQVVPSSVKLKLDNSAVLPASVNKVGAVTTVIYTQADPFPVGSSHKVDVEFQDNAGVTVTSTHNFVAQYVAIPADYRVASASNPGMVANVYQIDFVRTGVDENSIGSAEQQWARGFVDAGTGQPYANVAALSTDNVTQVNWDQAGGDIDVTPEDGPDNFNSALPAAAPVPNDYIPGIPGLGFDPGPGGRNGAADNNITVEVLTYLQLNKGAYRMGVNSDDGFKLSVAPGVGEVFGLVLGAFDGGRGAADTVFDFYVAESGHYPVRLLWWEGQGGANVEWYTVDLTTGEKTLVNGAGTKAVKAFRTANGRAYVKTFLPANGFTAADRRPTIKAELVNGTTSVVAGQTRLILDGAEVATGGNTVSYTPSKDFEFGSVHTGQLIWVESTTPPTTWTHTFTFTVKPAEPDDLPMPGSFWIEAEDFDYERGRHVAAASVMPYTGAAYEGLVAVYNVDYNSNNNNPDSDAGIDYTYRTDQRPRHVNVTSSNGNRYSNDRPGDVDVITNYRIGWAGGNQWWNYTRQIPPGVYKALAALSIADTNPDSMRANLHRVTAGVGTENQTLESLGQFRGRGSGGWGVNSLVPLKAADGSDAAFKITGSAPTTLRITSEAGDFDWFVLFPAANVPPQIKSATPANGDIVNLNAKLEFVIEDFSTTVNPGSIQLELDGRAVTPVVTKNADRTTVSYQPSALFVPDSAHTYKLAFSDSAGARQELNASFRAYPVGAPGMFVIEAEDYDYESGRSVPAASVMPYLGGAYNGLAATLDVDYHNEDGNDSDLYRPDQGPNNVNMNDNLGGRLGRARGLWDVTTNYKIGWVAATDWGNYTRNIPAGNYTVYAALSYDGLDADQLRASLGLVTAGKGTASQTVQPLGLFRAPGSGGWGANNLVPLTETGTGAPKVLALGGEHTFRFTMDSGDFDYFVLVPGAAEEPPRFQSIVRNANGTITVTWSGGGTLQAAPSVTGPWVDVTGATSPYTFTPTEQMLFGRIRR